MTADLFNIAKSLKTKHAAIITRKLKKILEPKDFAATLDWTSAQRLELLNSFHGNADFWDGSLTGNARKSLVLTIFYSYKDACIPKHRHRVKPIRMPPPVPPHSPGHAALG